MQFLDGNAYYGIGRKPKYEWSTKRSLNLTAFGDVNVAAAAIFAP